MEKLEIVKKAWEIDLTKIEEGFLWDSCMCYAENRNKAKSKLLKEIKYEDMYLAKYPVEDAEEVTYVNLPVIRMPSNDIVLFEGNEIQRGAIDKLLEKRNREQKYEAILRDNTVTHCYVIKRGLYYRPNSCGHTEREFDAGTYLKEDAVRKGRACDELTILAINTRLYNEMILEKINELKGKIIPI